MTEFVLPAYQDRSLCDVLPAVAAAIGRPLSGEPPALRFAPAPAYVVFLIDGLGWEQLARYAHVAPFLAGLMPDERPGTATVPSTTVTSLTSLGTGLAPGVHGVVGFTSRIPGTDDLLNALLWDRDVDPLRWQPHPTVFDRLREAGVRSSVVSKPAFEYSGLTLAAHRGADFYGVEEIDDRIAACVATSASGPAVTYVYESDLDSTGHRYGVASPEWMQALAAVDAQAEELREALPQKVRLLVTSDHGMVDSPLEARVDIDDHADLRDGVRLLGGEARFRHVYTSVGADDDVIATWQGVLGERAQVAAREDAHARGWFGTLSPTVEPRIGDVVVAARGDLGLMSSVDFNYELSLVGLHGSLTSAEMLIPLLVC